MQYVIGIDPGTKCGWSVIELVSGNRLASGVWNLKGGRHEGGGMRYVRARTFTMELLQAYDVFALVYEEVRGHKGTDAAHVYGGIVGQLTAVCEELCIPFDGIPVGTIKLVATGKGNASKAMMKAAANEQWAPHEVTDDNEADALWCAETFAINHRRTSRAKADPILAALKGW